jgi:hypothetical protein
LAWSDFDETPVRLEPLVPFVLLSFGFIIFPSFGSDGFGHMMTPHKESFFPDLGSHLQLLGSGT